MKKKIIVSLLAILTVIPLVLVRPKAAGSTLNGSGTSNYGSYNYQFSVILEQTEIGFNWGAEGLGLNIPLATGSSFNINFQFKDTYTGYVQFTLKSNTGVGYRLDECYWGVNGGYFNSSYLPSLTTVSTSKQFRIYVYNATEFSFTIVSPNVNTFHPTSTQYTGFGVTSFGYVLTDVGDIPDIAADIDLYIPGMSTNLSNIYNSLGYTPTSTLQNDINIIKNAVDGLEGYTDQLENLLSNISNIIPIGVDLMSVPAYIQFLNTGQSITNNSTVLPYSYFTFTGGTSYTLRFNLNQNESKYISFITGLSTPTWTLPENVTMQTVKYTGISPLYALVTLKFTNSGSYGWFDFVFTYQYTRNLVPIYFGDGSGLDTDIAGFIGVDSQNIITTRLDSIISAINAINDPYDTSQYEQYEQSIDNLNDNMRDRFNNSENTFQNNLNDIFVPDNEQVGGDSNTIFQQFHFNTINSLFSDFLGDIFDIAPALKYIMLFGLLLLVLGVLI